MSQVNLVRLGILSRVSEESTTAVARRVARDTVPIQG
jgi:hypothetical protein